MQTFLHVVKRAVIDIHFFQAKSAMENESKVILEAEPKSKQDAGFG